MVNLLRLGLVIFAVWLGLELFSKGVLGDMDGLMGGEKSTVETPSAARHHKAGAAVQDAHSAGEDRRNRLLAD